MIKLVISAVLVLFAPSLSAQSWSTFLDASRAIDWSSTAGFSIPAYSVNCATQPSLTPSSSGAAAANAASINTALASCDATHNVVNIPSGTYYTEGIEFGSQGKQVLRGAGASSTKLIFTADASCGGFGHGVCMLAGDWTYSGDAQVLPPSGTRQCSWTAGYTQGTTSITLSSCGGAPPLNKLLILDQANDLSDTGGVYMCDTDVSNCAYENGGNNYGRHIGSNYNSLQQVVYTTGVTSLGGGSYTVTFTPALYFTNVRTGQSPGAWWPGFVQNNGVENLSMDATSIGGTVTMFSCYQCWVKNTINLNGGRSDILLYQSLQSVIRDSYFYGAQSHFSTSYTLEPSSSSAFLIENNIFQQVTTPITLSSTSAGGVFSYNFAVKNIFADGSFTWAAYASHATANNFNLFEGNNVYGVWGDNASGPATQVTIFRNFLTGYQPGTTSTTIPILWRATNRALNIVGNVLGQPSYHNQYQAYATSTSAGTGGASELTSIYSIGWGGTGPTCTASLGQSTTCDPLTFSTMMRWGNYDTVNAATQWDSTEASPGAVTYVAANFTSGYFGSLAHTLPDSLYYASTPSWWPSGKAWPTIGPDISTGNVGICSGGTYASWPATSSSQCTGGTLSSGWASHSLSIPAMDCYLTTLNGPPDGSGSALAFDAPTCYSAPATPSGSALTGELTLSGKVTIHE